MATAGGVEFQRVSKRYGSVTAVDAVSFTIEPGTLVTLLGPSGCGKTTTLRMAAGLETASEGRILIGGEDVTRRPAAERDVSLVFQSYALFPHLSVLDNVCYGPLSLKVDKARARQMARDKLALLGLQGLEARLPSELSGGQQQRVAVARALVLEPRVLLFDEPLSNLDAKLRRRVRQEIRELQQSLQLTVLYVTHDQSEALAVSDRIIVMDGGRIAQQGTPQQLYQAPASRFMADFIGDANLVDGELVAGPAGSPSAWRFAAAGVSVPVPDAPGRRAGPATLALRPHQLLLRPPGQGLLDARCRRCDYLGSHTELVLDTPWGEWLGFGPAAGVVAGGAAGSPVTSAPDAHVAPVAPAAPVAGDTLGLAWAADAAVLLAR